MATPDPRNRLFIELHVSSFEPVLDFYGRLGFTKVAHRKERLDPEYLVMQKDGTIINFWPGTDQARTHSYFKQFPPDSQPGYGIELMIPVADIEAYYEQVRQFANIVSELKLRPWGVKDFRIADPFGFYLRITEPHDLLDPDYGLPKEPADS
jgi:lactoylglutathione lyase